MKLRIRGNSIRLRLLRPEVEALHTKGRVEESITFGPSDKESLTYAIQVSETAKEVTGGICENEVCLTVPAPIVSEWAASDQVGFSASHSNGDGELEILVEKDFACTTRTDDPDIKDAYPNPADEC